MVVRGKKITVVGLGKSGLAAAKFLAERSAKVRATDASTKPEVLQNASLLNTLGVETQTGAHTEAFIEKSDLVVTSPGVSKSSTPLVTAKKNKIPVISEIELAYLFCEGPITAVTGSNGKTTTCHLIDQILKDSGKQSVLCGNIGYSFLDSLKEINKKTPVVLELSSFQLEDCRDFRPAIAIILNISRNHLDRHKTIANYAKVKARIFKNQKASDILILNHEDALLRRLSKKAKARVIFFSTQTLKSGVYYENGKIHVNIGRENRYTLDTKNFLLKGKHNLQNILASVAAASILKVPQQSLQKTLNAFKTLEHRIEPLGAVKKVQFFNDSKSTTVESTRAAILAMESPLVLVAGGRDKGSEFETIEALIKKRVKLVVLYGESREKIAASWRSFKEVKLVEGFGEAVREAFQSARQGDSVLLSPMCTSFDQFRSYEERGQSFKRVYEEIKKEVSWKN